MEESREPMIIHPAIQSSSYDFRLVSILLKHGADTSTFVGETGMTVFTYIKENAIKESIIQVITADYEKRRRKFRLMRGDSSTSFSSHTTRSRASRSKIAGVKAKKQKNEHFSVDLSVKMPPAKDTKQGRGRKRKL